LFCIFCKLVLLTIGTSIEEGIEEEDDRMKMKVIEEKLIEVDQQVALPA